MGIRDCLGTAPYQRVIDCNQDARRQAKQQYALESPGQILAMTFPLGQVGFFLSSSRQLFCMCLAVAVLNGS